MKNIILVIVGLFTIIPSFAQVRKTKNLIIVTLDGMRWQEVYHGADY